MQLTNFGYSSTMRASSHETPLFTPSTRTVESANVSPMFHQQQFDSSHSVSAHSTRPCLNNTVRSAQLTHSGSNRYYHHLYQNLNVINADPSMHPFIPVGHRMYLNQTHPYANAVPPQLPRQPFPVVYSNMWPSTHSQLPSQTQQQSPQPHNYQRCPVQSPPPGPKQVVGPYQAASTAPGHSQSMTSTGGPNPSLTHTSRQLVIDRRPTTEINQSAPDPYQRGNYPPCKRNPPPPPPPRSNSWLGKGNNESSHAVHPMQPSTVPISSGRSQPIFVSSDTTHQPSVVPSLPPRSRGGHRTPCPLPTIAASIKSNPPVLDRVAYDSIGSLKPSGVFFDGNKAQMSTDIPQTFVSGSPHVPGSISAHNENSSRVTHVCNPTFVAHDSPITEHTGGMRDLVTDALLRLLVHHYASPPDNCEQADQKRFFNQPILDMLIQSVNNPAQVPPLSHAGNIQRDLALLARSIIPHLVRIVYTELVLADDGETNALHQWNGTMLGPTPIGDTLRVEQDFQMTSSISSKHSCGDDDEDDMNAADDATDLDAVCSSERPGALVSQVNGLNQWDNALAATELDALPPGTSMEELKQSAQESIARLIPLYQLDASLCERDMGIVRLLATIHAYTTATQYACMSGQLYPDPLFAARSTTAAAAAAAPKGNNANASQSQCPVAEVAALVRLSFHAEHRQAICDLGGVYALICLLRSEQAMSQARLLEVPSNTKNLEDNTGKRLPESSDSWWGCSLSLRQYTCMALTNLTYGVPTNKALLCRRPSNLDALLCQLAVGNDELKQVSAGLLRNLSWHTDSRSKVALRRLHAPERLIKAAMSSHRDSTLRTTLSALWNLSSHCSHNKRAVCRVDGALPFLVKTMDCDDPTRRLVIVENTCGILRNLSSVISVQDELRSLLNSSNCYSVLVRLLRLAPSLTVVVNVCSMLWNLTSLNHCPVSDLMQLRQLGVIDLLHQLTESPHEMISNSSVAVLRNLTQQQPVPVTTVNHSNQTLDHNLQSECITDVPNVVQNDSTSVFMERAKIATAQFKSQVDLESTQSTESSRSTESNDNKDASLSETEQTYRRRVNARSHLRFGLLSVVLEADADDEQDDEDDDDASEDSEINSVSDSNFVYNEHEPDTSQEELVVDSACGLLTPASVVVPITSNSDRLNDAPFSLSWVADDQTCVYAEEGTPFPPDSASESCSDLHRSVHPTDESILEAPMNADPAFSTAENSMQYLNNPSQYYCSQSLSRNVGEYSPYTLADVIPHVYALEGTPPENTSNVSLSGSIPTNLNSFHPVSSSIFLDQAVDCKSLNSSSDKLQDDVSNFPSPPPDVGNLSSPLLDDYDKLSHIRFALPPPPPPGLDTHPTHNASLSSVQETDQLIDETPLMFSRGSSSYFSSANLGASPRLLDSSPDSGQSRMELNQDTELDLTDLETSAGLSKGMTSRFDSDQEYKCSSSSDRDDADEVMGIDGNTEDAALQTYVSSSNAAPVLCTTSSSTHDVDPLGSTCTTDLDDSISHGNDGSCDDDDEDDDEHSQSQILQQCIASAMPSNTVYSISPGQTSIHVATTDTHALLFAVEEEDTVRSFALEDTPFGTSTKTSSLIDLLNFDQNTSPSKPCTADPTNLPVPFDPELTIVNRVSMPHSLPECPVMNSAATTEHHHSSSNSSSINDDTSSDLLSEVIQSAMPKSTQVTVFGNCQPEESVDTDCLQLYAVEGTPGADELSYASSVHQQLDRFADQPTVPTAPTPKSDKQLLLDSLHSLTLSSECNERELSENNPPPPPLRTTSSSLAAAAKTNSFTSVPTVQRPQAMVAPMPQIVRCPPTVPQAEDRLLEMDWLRKTSAHILPAPQLDKDDTSSFSSLLSIESVGLEHSLLQECISSAMPRPKVAAGHIISNRRRDGTGTHQLHSRSSFNDVPHEQEESDSVYDDSSADNPKVSVCQQTGTDDCTRTACEHLYENPVDRAKLISPSSSHLSPNAIISQKSEVGEGSAQRMIIDRCSKAGSTPRSAVHFLDSGSDDAHLPPPTFHPVMTATTTIQHQPHNDQSFITTDEHINHKNAHVIPVARNLPCALSEARTVGNRDANRSKEEKPKRFGSCTPPTATTKKTTANKLSNTTPTSPSNPIKLTGSRLLAPSSIPNSFTTDGGLAKVTPGHHLGTMLSQGAQAVIAKLQDMNDHPSVVSTDECIEGKNNETHLSDKVSNISNVRTCIPKTGQKTAGKSNLVPPTRIANVLAKPRLDTAGSVSSASADCNVSQNSKLNAANRTIPLTHHSNIATLKPHRTSTPSTPRKHCNDATSTPRNIHARSSVTCPPSTTNRSLASSRSTSNSNSVTNLVHNKLSNTSVRSQPVSAKLVRDALVKQERKSNTPKGGVDSKLTGRHPFIPRTHTGSSTFNGADADARTTTDGRQLTVQSSSNSLRAKTAPPTEQVIFKEFVHGTLDAESCPKPVRGGRKSLLGRKEGTANVTGKPCLAVNGQRPVSIKPRSVPGLAAVENRNGVDSSEVSTDFVYYNSANGPVLNGYKHCDDMFAKATAPTDLNSCSTGDSSGVNGGGMWIVRGELGLVGNFT